ncbi:hypothetical protein BB561_000828 [Smittium simulii]|uniref:Uncharacterized protein n=1 Tax=Smittium simulii TaxID=133385 RepID=A0A2T9YXC0_9FUNG|nr:hypothetical protein BB561_000828 [Smittium simulii]
MVQWLGFLAFTEAVGVRFPVSELQLPRTMLTGYEDSCEPEEKYDIKIALMVSTPSILSKPSKRKLPLSNSETPTR